MQYRLGTTPLQPDTPHAPWFGAQTRDRHELSGLVREMARVQLQAMRAPDLLAELRRDPGPDGWVFELAEVVDELQRTRCLRLARCESVPEPDGYTAVALVDESLQDDVREGDTLHAGVAVYRDAWRGVQVAPRIYRVVCTNGEVLHVGDDDGVRADHDLGAAVRSCLSGARFTGHVERLRAAAFEPGPDHTGELEAWREPGDDSRYGLLNAATARARTERHFVRRLQLERAASRLLDAPPRPRAAAVRETEPLLHAGR